jgi:hypothetical protein
MKVREELIGQKQAHHRVMKVDGDGTKEEASDLCVNDGK